MAAEEATERSGIGPTTPEVLEQYLVSQPLPDFDSALQDGCVIRAFRSGGGLHVISIEKDGALVGYGEHPYVEDALAHAKEDYDAGHREYTDVYGEIYPHYLTGSHEQRSKLGLWLGRGYSFGVEQSPEGVVVNLFGWERGGDISEEQQERILKTGEPLLVKDHGYTYRYARDRGGVSGVVVESPTDGSLAGSLVWESVRTATAPTMIEAFTQAFEAEPAERPQE